MSDLNPELMTKIDEFVHTMTASGDFSDAAPTDIAVAIGLIADVSPFGGGPLKILHSLANYYHDNPILANDFVAYMGGIPS